MDVPLKIDFHGIDKSQPLEDLIREKTEKLEQVCDHITSLRVVVEKNQQHQESGNPYRVRLDINVKPNHEFAIKRDPSTGHVHNDPYQMIRDAFSAARRKLVKITEKQQGKTKVHPEQEANAVVAKLFPDREYGFLRTLDERDVYFHKNALVGRDFDDLRVGTGVSATVVQGEEGLQASTVQIVDQPSV
jgi:cold shock CspA family protein